MVKRTTRHIYRVRYTQTEFTDYCHYCGADPSTRDHVPAMRQIDVHGMEKLLRLKAPFIVVDACKECNETLGSHDVWTIAQRLDYLFYEYSKKYSTDLTAPNWKLSELEELDYTLRTHIEAGNLAKPVIRHRLEHIKLTWKAAYMTGNRP